MPIFLRLDGRLVVVVGAGAVAERKVTELAESGARIRLIAPKATPVLEQMAKAGALTWEKRQFVKTDVDEAWLVVAATNDHEAQKAIFAACEANRVFLIAIDDIANCSAYSGSVLRRPPFTIALSSSGEAPALTRLLREVLTSALPPDNWVRTARAYRARWKAEKTPIEDRFWELTQALLQSKGRADTT